MLIFKNQKSNYWNQFPEDEKNFENEVRKGIWFSTDGKTVLPEPPEGYRWLVDNGGLTMSHKINYRLWSDRLGHMPGQE
jgi:hypothetical protein